MNYENSHTTPSPPLSLFVLIGPHYVEIHLAHNFLVEADWESCHCIRPWAHEHIFKCAKFPTTHAHIGSNSLLATTKRIFFSSSAGRNATVNPLLISMLLDSIGLPVRSRGKTRIGTQRRTSFTFDVIHQ